MWSDWLVFFDCGFPSICPLMEKDKRVMEASRWERLTEGETGSCFCFGFVTSFFLELFLHWSPVAPTDLGSSSLSVLSFFLFILFTGFLRQEYWSGLPFPSLVDHVLSELSTMTRPSCLHGMARSFIELDKAVVHVIRLVSFLWLWFSGILYLLGILKCLIMKWHNVWDLLQNNLGMR